VTDSDPPSTDQADPRSAAVTFVTTEHFVLQGARAATIAESNRRANMFLAAVWAASSPSAWWRPQAAWERPSTGSA
jgi:hypothetical protein